MEKSLSFLVAYDGSTARRGKPWGAVEGPAWRGLFAEESTSEHKCQKSENQRASHATVCVFWVYCDNKLHNAAES